MGRDAKAYSPLEIGLLTVASIWFLFSFHELFKAMININEFTSMTGPGAFWVMITDYSGAIGLIARTIAGIAAIVAIGMYIFRRLSSSSAVKVVKLVLVFEAIYWLSLLLSGIWGMLPVGTGGFGSTSSTVRFNLGFMIETGIPCLVESIAIPIALFKIVYELRPSRPMKNVIKWGLIAGTIYLLVFWLGNMGNWIYTIYYTGKGVSYMTGNAVNVLSFVLTTIGLLALTIYAAYFTKKSIGAQSIQELKLRTVGAIITLLGLYFLWNYLTWIYFGNNALWSQWFAWFLGHNMDLWALSLPLVGLPLLVKQKTQTEPSLAKT